jgi:hypothetical protein
MMLSEDKRTQLDGIVQQMAANNEPDADIQFVVNDFKGKYDTEAPNSSFMGRLGAQFDKRIENARKLQQNPNMTGVERAIGNAGQGWGMVADVPMEMLKSGVSAIPDFLKNAVTETQMPFLGGQSLKQVGQSAAPILGGISQGYNALEQAAPRVTNVLDAAGNALNLGGTLGMINPVAQAVRGAGAPIQGAATATKNAFFPKPTSEEALRQILQAARGQKNPAIISKNLAAGERALSRLDLKGVNTYNGIRAKLDEAIPALSKSVDDELLKNTKVYTLDDLATKQPVQPLGQGTAAIPQAPIEVNFAKDALTHLEELYTKIGEKGKAADIKNTLTRAEWDGISKKEVNDIARTYNKEFGDKAFDVKGDPLTSVNAQQYQTVRSGLKEVARRDMPPAAAELDGLMSDIYRTKDLISRNEAAVQRLKDTYKERGLGEKVISHAIAFADLATLGTVKGALLKLAPRGMGLKVNNWVEIENNLTRNLAILEKANAAKTNQEMASILNQNLRLRETKTVKNPTKEELIAAIQDRGFTLKGQPYGPEILRPVRPDAPIDAEFTSTTRGLLDQPRRDPTLMLPPGQGFTLVPPRDIPPVSGMMEPSPIRPATPRPNMGVGAIMSDALSDTPVYQAILELKRQGGLNRDGLIKVYGEARTKDIIREHPGLVSNTGAAKYDRVAEEFGFDGPDSLIRAIMEKPSKRALAKQTKEQYEQAFGADMEMAKKGYTKADSISAYNLDKGDKVMKDGEVFKVASEKDGILTLEDGVTIRVPLEDTLKIEGIKRKK